MIEVLREVLEPYAPSIEWRLRHIRGKRRDALTLLDDSGVLIPYSDDVLGATLVGVDWQTLFVGAKDAWGKKIDA